MIAGHKVPTAHDFCLLELTFGKRIEQVIFPLFRGIYRFSNTLGFAHISERVLERFFMNAPMPSGNNCVRLRVRLIVFWSDVTAPVKLLPSSIGSLAEVVPIPYLAIDKATLSSAFPAPIEFMGISRATTSMVALVTTVFLKVSTTIFCMANLTMT